MPTSNTLVCGPVRSFLNTSTYSNNIFSDLQATPGFKAAQAATLAANEALAAFQAEGRAAFIARILGPNAAAQGAQRQIMLTNTALAAARQEALIDVQIANAGKWSSRLGRLGLVCAQFSD